jgi:hypothetical protein
MEGMACAHPWPASARPAVYRPRSPQQTDFYKLVEDNLETFLALANDPLCTSEPSVAPHAETAPRDFLTCGLSGEGVALAACETCGRMMAVPFSCKRRCPCPSCATKLMSRTAARLVEEVVPDVPMRMWVLTLPKRLRWFLDRDRKVCDGVSRILATEVDRFLGKAAGMQEGRSGSLQFLQWGSSHDLKKHLHFHQMSTDGVFVERESAAAFHEAKPPAPGEVRAVEQRIARRVLKLFVRRGHLEKEEMDGWMKWEHSGFSLDASVAVEAPDRAGLERLLRYCGRPNFKASNVAYEPDKERVVYKLPKPHVDGRTELVLTPMEFLGRVAELIPTPRRNLLRFWGVFAPNHAMRRTIVRCAKGEQIAVFPSEKKKRTRRTRARLTWAALIRRIFEDDPLRCPCGGQMRIVKFLTEPSECAEFLESHGLQIATADPKPARAPPRLEEFEEPAFEDYLEPEIPDELQVMDPPVHED